MTTDVTKILTATQIKQYRAGYDEVWMNASAEAAVIAPYPQAAPLAGAITKLFYSPGGPLTPAEREMSVLGTLASGPNQLYIAIHLYWGLAVGLSPNKQADTLLLMGVYKGIEVYTASISTMQLAYTTLQTLAKAYPPPKPIPSQAAVGALVEVFNPPPEQTLKARFPKGFKASGK